jgi:hypothetical protein
VQKAATRAAINVVGDLVDQTYQVLFVIHERMTGRTIKPVASTVLDRTHEHEANPRKSAKRRKPHERVVLVWLTSTA